MGLSQNLHKKIIVMECHSCGLKTGKNKCTVWLQHNIKVTKWKAYSTNTKIIRDILQIQGF